MPDQEQTLTDQITIEKVYPLSVLEGTQKGEIYVDDDKAPASALIWHYCGFANIVGDQNEGFIEEVMHMMQDPPEGHSGRLVLQTDNDDSLQDIIMRNPMVARYERYVFAYQKLFWVFSDRRRTYGRMCFLFRYFK